MPARSYRPLVAAIVTLAACGGTSTTTRNSGETADPADEAQPPGELTGDGKTRDEVRYPVARKDRTVDDYHGTKVADPYRWLEDPDSPDTRAWIEAENKVTFAFLESIPQRKPIEKRITELWNYEKYSAPARVAKRYFWSKNDGLQNQSVVYWSDSLKGEPKLLIDPNKLSADGTVALAGMAVSEDAKLVAYGLQSAGSDWVEWRVRSIDKGEDLSDHLKWVKFSGASWSHDNKGFYYSRYPEPKEGEAMTDANLNHKLYYHRLGDPQAKDVLVYERPDEPKWGFGGSVTEDGRYLVVSVWKGTGPKNLVLYQDLSKSKAGGKGKVETLIGEFEAKFELIGNQGPIFWFVTDLDAPRGRVVAIDIRKPQKKDWKQLVAQGTDSVQVASSAGNKIFVEYLQDARSRVAVHDLKGKRLGEVALPGLGSASGFLGRKEHAETFYSYTSFTSPDTIFRYDIKTGKSEVFRAPKVAFDGSKYESKQVFVNSKDSTRVPMFITHKKGMVLDGNNPTLLYGYGGFNVSVTPSFSVVTSVWMDMGGVLAVANLRGGGEYGEEWHLAGTKLKKQNVFDDFIAASEWLVTNKYTSPKRLAIQGGSNGGLLVGAAMTQRPELFGAALPQVGVMDMLRFHKFTIGWAWVDDYGSSDNPDEFKALLAYSPLHSIKSGVEYPPTLITTADHDDRVVPGHSFKFAAALQAAHKGDNPVLIRIQTKAGHGGGKPTKMKIEEAADQVAFLVKVFGM